MRSLFRRLGWLLLALLTCLWAPASARELPVAPAETAEQARPALWKLSDEDTTVWLFGTIHALPKGIEWFGGPVQQGFDGSQELVTEITETDPLEMQRLVIAHATLPEGQSLRALLTPEERNAYERALSELGLPHEVLDGVEPWYAAMFLSLQPLIRAGYDSANGVEKLLSARAKALERPHSALESAAYQIGLFDSLPVDAQKRYFAQVLEKLPTMSADLATIVAAWGKGDTETLARLVNAEEDDPAMLEMLLIRRNKAWAEWIAQRLDKPGTVFVAVGAGHLAGSGSLQDQLAARGLTVQRVQ